MRILRFLCVLMLLTACKGGQTGNNAVPALKGSAPLRLDSISISAGVPHNMAEMEMIARSLSGALDTIPVLKLLDKVKHNKGALDEFAQLAKTTWNDANSPYRNDELYLPVLRAQISSGLYDEASVIRLNYQENLLSQNRLGRKANDIEFMTRDGHSGHLYDISSRFTLLYFNNPGCNMCAEITAGLKASGIMSFLVSSGVLKILSIYPDELLDEWLEHYDEQPSSWIRSYDKGCRILQNGTYNLAAIPSLYLLDANKTVLIKDASDVRQIELAITNLLN